MEKNAAAAAWRVSTAVLVAGGLGTRIRSISGDGLPKALVPIAGKAVGVRMLELLAREGISRVAVTAGHLATRLEEGLRPEAERFGLELTVFEEPKPLGTAGFLKELGGYLGGEESFLIVYADVVADLDLGRLHAFHVERGADVTVASHPNDHPATSDLVVADDDGRIVAVHPVRSARPELLPNLVPAAVYCASPALLGWIEDGVRQDFVGDVLPRMVAGGARVFAYRTTEYLKDMGSEQRFSLVERDLAEGRPGRLALSAPRPAVFLDRDGVMNEEVGGHGLLGTEGLRILPGVGGAVSRLNRADCLAVVTTNQPQLAKGLLSRPGLDEIHARLETELGREGAWLDRIYHCPHHPDRGFAGEVAELKRECACRKPQSGMILRAAEELPVDLSRSSMIGDSWRDVGAARAAGIWAYTVRTGVGGRDCGSRWRPDAAFEDVAEAVEFLLEGLHAAKPLCDAVEDRLRNANRPVVVGISGPPRAGKSVLAHALVRLLTERGHTSLHVRLDDWIVPRSARRPGMPSSERCRVEAYPEILRRLTGGDSVDVRAYDPWSREASDQVAYEVRGAHVLLLDGIWACGAEIRSQLDLAVWLETPYVTLRDRMRLFSRWKGDDVAEVETRSGEALIEEIGQAACQRDSVDRVVEPDLVTSLPSKEP